MLNKQHQQQKHRQSTISQQLTTLVLIHPDFLIINIQKKIENQCNRKVLNSKMLLIQNKIPIRIITLQL